MKCKDSGYSLVEVCVVICLIGVLVGLAAPQLASAGMRLRERAAVAEFASELRTARMLALTHRKKIDVHIAPDGRSVRVASVSDPDSILRTYPFPPGSVSVEGWAPERTLRFQPNGRSASPATLILRGREGARWEMTVSIAGRVGVS